MQPPMSAAFVRKRKTVAALHCGPYFGIEAFVNDDSTAVEPDCAEDVGVQARPTARHIEQPVQVVELDAKLEVLLDDILDQNRCPYLRAFGGRILREQGRGIAFDSIVVYIGN